jgi:hypothetical protein
MRNTIQLTRKMAAFSWSCSGEHHRRPRAEAADFVKFVPIRNFPHLFVSSNAFADIVSVVIFSTQNFSSRCSGLPHYPVLVNTIVNRNMPGSVVVSWF